MKKTTPGRRSVGRPKVDIDPKHVKLLAFQGHTDIGIGQALGISQSTLQNFRGALKEGRIDLDNALRAMQVKKALDGDSTMLRWLGIQICGQRSQLGISNPSGGPVELTRTLVTVDL